MSAPLAENGAAVGRRTVASEVYDSTHPDHVHRCASVGYPSHEPSRLCICAGCGERFDATVLPSATPDATEPRP